MQFFIDANYDNAGILCIAELAHKLGVEVSITTDIKPKVLNVFSCSLRVSFCVIECILSFFIIIIRAVELMH